MPNISPMAISIWFGKGKPLLTPFLEPFVNELNDILKNGLEINGHQLKISIRCFICDLPARSFLKGELNFFKEKTHTIF